VIRVYEINWCDAMNISSQFCKQFANRILYPPCYIRQLSTRRVCIIGSGPAGFYTAQHILKNYGDVKVDIFEKLPVPFGLVRYGVAPDHPEVKNATSSFEEVAKDERCRFFGNVNIGVDLTANELRQHYEAVVFAYGADDDKKLNIPGEDSKGLLAARSFVGWYNGLPAHADLTPNLDCDTAIIVGQGNVALDVARILLAPISMLKHTDICEHAIEALRNSRIKNVHIIGRRSPLEVAFTIKELREQIKLPNCKPVFNQEHFKELKEEIRNVPRHRKRLMELMYKTAMEPPSLNSEGEVKKWYLDFLKSPVEVLNDGHNNVRALRMEQNQLVQGDKGVNRAIGTGKMVDLSCGLILRSIGYKSIRVEDGIPFDTRLGVIPNIDGRVVSEAGSKQLVKGLYCSGWVKHGPVGVIATTMNESYATAQNIVHDLQSDDKVLNDSFDVEQVMNDRGIGFVSFENYEKINSEEIWRGLKCDKPREKITSSQEMLDVAWNATKDIQSENR